MVADIRVFIHSLTSLLLMLNVFIFKDLRQLKQALLHNSVTGVLLVLLVVLYLGLSYVNFTNDKF